MSGCDTEFTCLRYIALRPVDRRTDGQTHTERHKQIWRSRRRCVVYSMHVVCRKWRRQSEVGVTRTLIRQWGAPWTREIAFGRRTGANTDRIGSVNAGTRVARGTADVKNRLTIKQDPLFTAFNYCEDETTASLYSIKNNNINNNKINIQNNH